MCFERSKTFKKLSNFHASDIIWSSRVNGTHPIVNQSGNFLPCILCTCVLGEYSNIVSYVGASTSGVSTVNSVGAHGAIGAAGGAEVHHPAHHHHHHGAAAAAAAASSHAVHGQLQQLREENGRLLSQLLDLQRGYQNLLRHNLDEQRLHLNALRQHMGQAGQLRSIWR